MTINSLHESASTANVALLEQMLQKNPQIVVSQLYEKDEKGKTPLHIIAKSAATANTPDMVTSSINWIKQLIKYNALLSDLLLIPDSHGDTPLHYLIKLNDEPILDYCIRVLDNAYQNREYLYVKDSRLTQVWYYKSRQALETLIKYDDEKYHYLIDSPLHDVIRKPHKEFVEEVNKWIDKKLIKPFMLLRTDYALNCSNNTPLNLLIFKHNNEKGIHLLSRLIKCGYEDVINIAQENGIDTWLHDLLSLNKANAYLQILLDEHALPYQSLSSKDKYGRYPLHCAITNPSLKCEIINKLVEAGADVNAQNAQLDTPLHVAIYSGSPENLGNAKIIIALIRAGAKTTLSDKNGKTPVQVAFDKHNFWAASALYKSDPHNNSPLCREKLLATQFIYSVFGGQKLKKLGYIPEFLSLSKRDLVDKIIPLLKQSLISFANKEGTNEENFTQLIKFIDNFKPIHELANENVFQRIISGETVFTEFCSKSHLVGIMITKVNDNDIALSIANKGYWSYGNSAIQTIFFKADKEKLSYILDLLRNANRLYEAEAADILFKQIPQFLGSHFSNINALGNPLVSKKFKEQICAFANLKTALHNEFIIVFDGLQKGQLSYKKYDLALHDFAIENYKNKVSPDLWNQDLIKICEEIIASKKLTYATKYNENNNRSATENENQSCLRFI